MTNEHYRKALEEALKELESLLKEEEKMQERMLALRKTINVLATLCEEAGEAFDFRGQASTRVMQVFNSTLTDDILKVVAAASPIPLTTSEVRVELNKLGGSLAEQKNPLATVNAILNRLTEQKKLTETLKS